MAAIVLVAEVIPEKGIAEAVIPTVQVKVPVALATVQPVEPAPPPIKMSPVPVEFKLSALEPLASIEKGILVSPPVAAKVTVPPVAAFVRVASLIAEAVVPNLIDSLPLLSRISPPLTCRSSAIIVFVPEASIVISPLVSTPNVALSVASNDNFN